MPDNAAMRGMWEAQRAGGTYNMLTGEMGGAVGKLGKYKLPRGGKTARVERVDPEWMQFYQYSRGNEKLRGMSPDQILQYWNSGMFDGVKHNLDMRGLHWAELERLARP